MDNTIGKSPKLLSIIFLIFEVLFIIFVIYSIPNLLPNNEILPYSYSKMTSMQIENIRETFSGLSDFDIQVIEGNLAYVVGFNASDRSISREDTKAEIVQDTAKIVYFKNQNVNFISAVLDIPDLSQSYQLYYEFSSDNDNKYIDYSLPGAILCPVDNAILYRSFECEEVFDYYERPKIVSGVISYFSFEDMSLYINNNNPNQIVINPGSLNADEQTKASYINRAKESVESLGVPADTFNYHILDPSEITFDFFVSD